MPGQELGPDQDLGGRAGRARLGLFACGRCWWLTRSLESTEVAVLASGARPVDSVQRAHRRRRGCRRTGGWADPRRRRVPAERSGAERVRGSRLRRLRHLARGGRGQSRESAGSVPSDRYPPVPDLAWTYHDPQREASEVRGLVAFFDERADVVLDGTHLERPMTLVSTSGNLSRSSAGRPRDPARGLISCAMLRGATAPHPG